MAEFSSIKAEGVRGERGRQALQRGQWCGTVTIKSMKERTLITKELMKEKGCQCRGSCAGDEPRAVCFPIQVVWGHAKMG